jgi:hypothetical protein
MWGVAAGCMMTVGLLDGFGYKIFLAAIGPLLVAFFLNEYYISQASG